MLTLPGLLLGKKLQKRHLSVRVYLRAYKPLWGCLRLNVGKKTTVEVLIQRNWHTLLISLGVSQHFADAVLPHIFLEAGLEAKCFSVTIFLGENKWHIYGSAHDFVWLRVCRSWSSPSNCTYRNICQSLVGLFGFCGIRPTKNGVNKHRGLKRGLPTDV